MASSKAQRRSFDVALKLRAVEFAVKNGKDAVRCGLKADKHCKLVVLHIHRARFQIQLFANNRGPDGFINVMASHNTVFTQLLHVCVSCFLRVNSDLARAHAV